MAARICLSRPQLQERGNFNPCFYHINPLERMQDFLAHLHLDDRGRSVGRAEETLDKRIHLSEERGEPAIDGTSFLSVLKKIGVDTETTPYRLANSADVCTSLIRHFRQNRQALEFFIAGTVSI